MASITMWGRGKVYGIMPPKDADEIGNSEDPDQTAPDPLGVCTVCPDLSVQKLWIIYISSFQKIVSSGFLNNSDSKLPA